MPYPLLKCLEGFPEVTVVSKMEQEEMNFGGIWHSDTAYLETPPMASLLYALEVPEHAGTPYSQTRPWLTNHSRKP